MKSWSSFARVLAVLGLYAGGAAPAFADGPVLVTSPVEKAFVPLGFDDNDNAEVVIYGHFTSTCFKTGPAKATVDYDTMTVTVDAQAYRYTGGCAQVVVPFTQSVKFGQVRAGSYTVVVTNRPEAGTAGLDVAFATTNSADDFNYLPVGAVRMSMLADGSRQLTLEGEYPYTFVGCMTSKEVRATVTPGYVVVVQPIGEFVQDERDPRCLAQRESKKFVLTKIVDGPFRGTDYLIHVRVLAGSSLNQIVDLRGR